MDENEDFMNKTPHEREEQWPYGLAESLTIFQTLQLIWGLIALIPNAVLIYILTKNKLHQTSNFYFTILHWTIANTVVIVASLPTTLTPEVYFIWVGATLYTTDIIFRAVPIIFGTFFIFDKFIKSKNFCRYSIYCIWAIITIAQVTTLILQYLNLWHIAGILVVAALFMNILCLLILIIKSILHCIPGSDEETCVLRYIFATVYMTIAFIHWIYEETNPIQSFSDLPRHILIVMLYGNSLFNLILLVLYNPTVKMYFYHLCRNSNSDVEIYSSKNKNNLASNSEGHQATPQQDTV